MARGKGVELAGNPIQKTGDQKWIIALRVLAGGPLLAFGAMHLVGAMPMRPLLDAAGLPAPGLMAMLAPLMQVVAGASLLAGAFARVGGVLGIAAMGGALVTHLKIPNDKWPDVAKYAENPEAWNAAPTYMEEPAMMMFMAIGILLMSAAVVFLGAGAFSVDAKASGAPRGE